MQSHNSEETLVHSDRIEQLTKYGLIYLASPYTKYKRGLYAAFLDAAKIAARLAKQEVRVYCPVVYSHVLAVQGGISPVDHKFWMNYDRPFMDACGALLVARVGRWGESEGIAEEREIFRAAGKPTFFVDPETLEIT